MPLEFTGERYVPELTSSKISYEHWHRYLYAKNFVDRKIVLDVACGEGYGTACLAEFAKHVSGIDKSEETILHAQKKYILNNLSFVVGGADSLPFNNETFDVIVSFETIEHLTSEDQHAFLKEARRTLKKEGCLLISTPNKKVYSDDANYQNPFHLAEFYEDEFTNFLKTEFEHITIFQQQLFCGSLIASYPNPTWKPETIELTENGFIPSPNKAFQSAEYLIGICSNSTFSLPPNGLLVDSKNQLYSEYNS